MLRDKLGESKIAKPKAGELKYFNAQSAALVSAVQVFPENAKEISTVLQVVQDLQTSFAVKAGGHGVKAGASSIEGGPVSLGAEAKWVDVYGKLDQMGISVPGGRISTVGVGGLTLGGSSRRRENSICHARNSPRSLLGTPRRRDEFGVVTTFEFVAFERSQIWGGVKQYLEDSETPAIALLDAFCKSQDLSSSSFADAYAEAFIIAAYVAPMAKFITTAVSSHGKPEDDPPVFGGFTALPSIASSTKIRSIADLAVELNANNPHRLRYDTLALTVKSNAEIRTGVLAIYKDVISPHKDTVKNFVPAILLQPLLPRMLPASGSEHTLGLTREDGPPFAGDGDGDSPGQVHRYVYLTYAAGDQDVFASYGQDNLERLLGSMTRTRSSPS
ncbi:uncharacterized protein Z519_00215 [Cladophialophora bantiana CBS 173.52]|uniref:FAD-binding PCMH-type domain-containing protein n=1 Tax=Cladophialophora bantiana (strain ATCC 10958 / CBS 173.52 / CDC B-1940 / NIH 8579) TaxID=1442370 RepID=A0A0D2IP93_CLAB1|nr:uncharacterized protein Z519_00215 [Cladophialophora bantiana CBS 173.52]KIW98554.1 hypothetical protein Z519_00215 [Cladophialophora bantiana CBS 173.52]